MPYQKIILFLLLFINLSGCSTIDYRGENKFQPRIKAFAHALRWSQFEKAKSFIRLRHPPTPRQNQEHLKQIKVTKYEPLNEVSRTISGQGSTEIISTYTLNYYHRDNYKIKHQQYEQVWWYDDTIGTWFLDSELPTFKQ